jgi:4-amino-4-deoxy-L-arabinose transferase-like glycosyltransferase
MKNIIHAKFIMTYNNHKKLHYIIFALIILLGFFVRIYHIDSVPSGIYPDEANNGTNAFDAQQTNIYPWFYPDNNGREGLFINLIAILFKLFGVNIITFKLPAIIMGTLTVIGVYFLSRELFISRPRLALIAAYLTATSYWAVNFSRICFRANMMVPILVFLFYFLFKAIRTRKPLYFAIAGALCGLGFHTYIAYRITPVLVFIFFVLFAIQQGFSHFIKRYWKGLLLFLISMFLIFAPMGYTYYTHPEYLTSRTGDISVFAVKDASLTQTLTHTIIASLLKYNIAGDNNWRHNFPPYPLLEPYAGLMFLGGIITSIGLFFLFLFRRYRFNVRNRAFVVHGFLLAWFVGFLAPEFLTTEGLPHALRSIGTIPVVFIFAAFFITVLLERSQKHSHLLFVVTSVMTIALLIYSGFFDMIKYHVFWATNVNQAYAFNKNLTDMGRLVHDLPQNEAQIYIVAGHMDLLPVKILTTNRTDTHYIYENDLAQIDTTQPFIIFLPYENTAVIDYVSKNSDVMIEKIQNPLNSSFVMVTSINNQKL